MFLCRSFDCVTEFPVEEWVGLKNTWIRSKFNKWIELKCKRPLIWLHILTSFAGIFVIISTKTLWLYFKFNQIMDLLMVFMNYYDINAVCNNSSNIFLPKFDVIYAFEYRWFLCFFFVVIFFSSPYWLQPLCWIESARSICMPMWHLVGQTLKWQFDWTVKTADAAFNFVYQPVSIIFRKKTINLYSFLGLI